MYRRVVQETFKGYGNGLSMMVLLNKGLYFDITPQYFLFILLVRGSVSIIYKTICVSYIRKRPIKHKKVYAKLKYNTLPAMVVFLVILWAINNYNKILAREIEIHITSIYVTFMIVIRTLRMVTGEIKTLERKALKVSNGGTKLSKSAIVNMQ